MGDREMSAAELVTQLEVPAFDFDADDFLVGAILIVKVQDASDRTGVHVKATSSIKWLDRIGILTFASDVEREDGVRMALDDHDD